MAITAERKTYPTLETSPKKIFGKLLRGAERLVAKFDQHSSEMLKRIDIAFPFSYKKPEAPKTDETFAPFKFNDPLPQTETPTTPVPEIKVLPEESEPKVISSSRSHRLSPNSGPEQTTPRSFRDSIVSVQTARTHRAMTIIGPTLPRAHRLENFFSPAEPDSSAISKFFLEISRHPKAPQPGEDLDTDLVRARVLNGISPSSSTPSDDLGMLERYYRLAKTHYQSPL